MAGARALSSRTAPWCRFPSLLRRLKRAMSRLIFKVETSAHLDPDLCATALPRLPGWRPIFGQTQGQLTHLMNCGVEPGDLFLFFGWFREVEEQTGGTLAKARAGQNRHVFFGWLQVDTIIDVGSNGRLAVEQYPWLHDHPHVSGSWNLKNSGSSSIPL